MSNEFNNNIDELVKIRNSNKYIFTAGPASLIKENLTGLRPCFGRGDKDYDFVESSVLEGLKRLSGHNKIVRLQGSASLALEIMSFNFLYGRVLVISSGFYSDRLEKLANSAKRMLGQITKVDVVDIFSFNEVNEKYDWIVSCYTETSRGIKIPIKALSLKAKELSSKIMLDATASIGLENHHYLADVIGYSSCKGLFGLTGASFIAFNEDPKVNVDSFYLSLDSHRNKKMTGPYHSICSLFEVLPKHDQFRYSVQKNKEIFMKKYSQYININEDYQPLLCTYINKKIKTNESKAVLYEPRDLSEGSIVCHLGEVHLGIESKGDIINVLDI